MRKHSFKVLESKIFKIVILFSVFVLLFGLSSCEKSEEERLNEAIEYVYKLDETVPILRWAEVEGKTFIVHFAISDIKALVELGQGNYAIKQANENYESIRQLLKNYQLEDYTIRQEYTTFADQETPIFILNNETIIYDYRQVYEEAKEKERLAKIIDLDSMLLFENNDCKISAISYDTESLKLKLLIENDSPNSIVIQTREDSANGFMVNGLLSCEVGPNKKAYDEVQYTAQSFRDSEVDIVCELGMRFAIMIDGSLSSLYETEYVTIQIPQN